MNKIKIICTKEEAREIRNIGSQCLGPMICPVTHCKDCQYFLQNIEFIIKESED